MRMIINFFFAEKKLKSEFLKIILPRTLVHKKMDNLCKKMEELKIVTNEISVISDKLSNMNGELERLKSEKTRLEREIAVKKLDIKIEKRIKKIKRDCEIAFIIGDARRETKKGLCPLCFTYSHNFKHCDKACKKCRELGITKTKNSCLRHSKLSCKPVLSKTQVDSAFQ